MNINVISYFNYTFGISKMASNFINLLDIYKIKYTKYNLISKLHISTSSNCVNLNMNQIFNNCINIFIVVDKILLLELVKKKNIFNNKNKNYLIYVQEVEGQEKLYINILNKFNKIIVPNKYVSDFIYNYNSNIYILPIIDINYQKFNLVYNIPFNEKIICFYMCDVFSCEYRKNIDGYIKLIENINDDGFFFILKIINLDENSDLFLKLNNIKNKKFKLINFMMNELEINKLFDIIDIFIGLQRAEGYGYSLIDACMKNKYILSTLYSAQKDYLINYNKFIEIDHKLVNISNFPKSSYCKYSKNGMWCEPDINDCINKLKQIDILKKIPNFNFNIENKLKELELL